MKVLSKASVARLQSIVKRMFYVDYGTLRHNVRTGEYDSMNRPVVDVVEISFFCNFNDENGSEDWQEFADVQNVTGVVRFEGGAPMKGDIFILTKRFGSDIGSPVEYEVAGIKHRGTFGWVVALRSISI